MTYEAISYSNIYYRINGYEYIQTPWIVSEQTSQITKPKDKKDFFVNDKVLVASGEQSFLELIRLKQLEPHKRFQTTTPCFRDENVDVLHKTYFMKTELIYFEYFDKTNEQIERFKHEVDNMCQNICKKFYNKYIPSKTIPIESTNENKELYLFDIVTDNSFETELGSYGIRLCDNIIWAYGTGCAEPRLSYAIGQVKTPGYHITPIPKTNELGSVEKIMEEYEEFMDSIKQNTCVMELIELSDLIGAIDFYVAKKYNMSINDLIKFKDITVRAFASGNRK